MSKLLKTCITGLAFLSIAAFAQSSDGIPSYAHDQGGESTQNDMGQGQNGRQSMRRRGPPPQATEACQGKNAQAACSFVTPRGDTISGTCRRLPDNKFACVPANRRPPGGAQGGQRRQQGGAADGGAGY